MENKIPDKEKAKDLKVFNDIRMGNFGDNKDKINLDAQNKSKHNPYYPNVDTRNGRYTVSSRTFSPR